MTANYIHKDTAGLSPNNSRKDLGVASNITSFQQFQENNKTGRSIAMDYEVILYSQIEQVEECSIPKSDWNEKDSNDDGNGEIVCDDQICSTACDKDVDFDMGVKDCSDSGIDKDEDCGIDIKLREESGLNDTIYVRSQSQSGFLGGADIESYVDYEIVRKHQEDCEKIEANNSNESSRDNSKMSNVDCDKMENVICDEQCDDSNMPSQKSSVGNFLDNDDDFDITSADSDEEFQLDSRHKLPFLGGKGKNKNSNLKPHVNDPARKAVVNLKPEATIFSELANNQVNDLNLQENEQFVQHVDTNDINIQNKVFCLQVSQDSTNVRSRKANQLELDRTLSKSEHSPQILSNDFLNDLQGDSTSDWDIDLLTPAETNLEENLPSDSKCQVDSRVFLSQHSNSNSLQLDDFDNVDGMCPAHSDGSYCQSVNNDALSTFTRNTSVSNSLVVPSSKVLDNNDMLTSSDPLDSNSNHIINSILETKTDPMTYDVPQDCMPISAQNVGKTESFDSSRHLQRDQKSKPCSDTGIALAKYNLSSARADTMTLGSPSSLWPTHRRSSTCDSQHISDHPKKELNLSYLTQSDSADETRIPAITASPLMESTDSLIDWIEDDGSPRTSASIQKPQVPSHSHQEEVTPQHILPNISTVRDNTINIPSTSAYSPEKVETTTACSLGTTEHFSATENVLATNSIALLFQASVSSPSPTVENAKSVTDNRHIKSILNTYVSHKLSSVDYSYEDISNVADEFALVFNGSRKRSYRTNHSSTAPVTKKHYFGGSSLTEDDESSSSGSTMNVDVVSSPYGRPEVQTRKSVANADAVIRLCKICDTSGPGLKSIKCRNSHVICQSCLEDEIRLVMASEKMCLSCPEEYCKAAITIDCLTSVLSPLIVDLLSDNLRLKEQRASAKAIRKMQGLVVCPHCFCPGVTGEHQLHFVCATCKRGCCCYCKRPWLRSEEHDCCFLLSFVGTECLMDISKQPQNWNMGITPFNKNFVQINVPLNSTEGSAVAAFCAKTSSGKSNVIQIFRIQNVKLWEKYVLKRKHVEDEIGAAEVKENFLFHGTKAENIVKICGEGFDIRVPTSNGALLGKGIYFSISARYSEKFADKSGRLFLSRVICGWSQAGQRQLTRPLYHGLSRRMYDSCVDNVSSPTMYTVFDNSQCYPEYLVQFSQ